LFGAVLLTSWPAGMMENGEREIDVVRREIELMPSEGGIVTPERHEVNFVGSEGRALRAEGYLSHFKQRVFSGLGMSGVDFGEGACYSYDTETLTENGWKVGGVELTRNAVSYAKKKYGIKLFQGDFLEKKIKDVYDVVVLNGALEHLRRPFETLARTRSILKNGGFILISIPNSDSLGRNIFGKNWFAWQPPRHLYHFSPKTVRQMLKKACKQ